MHYATLNGGKRIRPLLVYATGEMLGIDAALLDAPAVAVELIHAFSLVHDDLPAMDDDDTRRGNPTVHVKWDDATAILAGDALQTIAFEILAAPQTAPDPAVRLKLISRLALAAGSKGMVGGQALDIAAETAKTPLDLPAIKELQAKKTGALITWAAEAGPLLGKADMSAMTAYSEALGLAFQIQDDILDVTGDADVAGKRLRKDEDAGKATFVSLLGLDNAQREAYRLAEAACDAISAYGSAGENLRQTALYVVSRDK